MKNFLKLIRVKHYLKNILVFLPLFFSGNVLNTKLLLLTFISFLVFSFSSSIVYIINDISDIENDRKHPIKKNRPLASGKISIKTAYIIIFILFLLVSSGITYLYLKTHNLLSIIIPIIYILLNILYSKGLKNIAIIDLLILTSGFIFRVIFGAVNIDVEVSKYLYLMIIFGSYYLSLGKRREEIIKNGFKSRKVLEKYNKEFLDKNMYVTYGLSIVSYTLWCVDKEVTLRIGHDYLFWSIPLLMIIFQLYSLNIEKDSYGDPVDVILSDKKLLITGVIYAIIMILLIYVI
jgi:4-hydroxybenzoate polyprenyltransferase